MLSSQNSFLVYSKRALFFVVMHTLLQPFFGLTKLPILSFFTMWTARLAVPSLCVNVTVHSNRSKGKIPCGDCFDREPFTKHKYSASPNVDELL
jgi:hypothetical protein